MCWRRLVRNRPLAGELVGRDRRGEQSGHRGRDAREQDHREDGLDQREARLAAQAQSASQKPRICAHIVSHIDRRR
jgi:hypothetical protein